jgi:hypothetical protein
VDEIHEFSAFDFSSFSWALFQAYSLTRSNHLKILEEIKIIYLYRYKCFSLAASAWSDWLLAVPFHTYNDDLSPSSNNNKTEQAATFLISRIVPRPRAWIPDY